MKNDASILIEKYLLGQLSAAEAQQVEERARMDADFARELQLQRDVLTGIEFFGDENLRAKIAAADRLMEAKGFFKPGASGAGSGGTHLGYSTHRPWWAAAAILLLAVTGAGWWWMHQQPQASSPDVNAGAPAAAPQLETPLNDVPAPPGKQPDKTTAPTAQHKPGRADTRYLALATQKLPDPLSSNLRRPAADSTAGVFQQAQLSFAVGDYRQTLALLAQTDSTRRQSAVFLTAHTLFRLGRFEEAEAQFAQLVAWNSRQYRYPGEWGVLMCRLADFPRRKNEVQGQLNEILAKPEHPFFEQAKDLQKALNE